MRVFHVEASLGCIALALVAVTCRAVVVEAVGFVETFVKPVVVSLVEVLFIMFEEKTCVNAAYVRASIIKRQEQNLTRPWSSLLFKQQTKQSIDFPPYY